MTGRAGTTYTRCGNNDGLDAACSHFDWTPTRRFKPELRFVRGAKTDALRASPTVCPIPRIQIRPRSVPEPITNWPSAMS
jgi:hypothetical protein